MNDAQHKLRKRRRGTASVEVVMMLPFFILVFAGLYYMHGLYAGRQLAMTKARACGWAYAKAGCQGTRPSECPGPEGGDPGGASVQAGQVAGNGNAGTGSAGQLVETIGAIPVIGNILVAPFEMLFGKPLTTNARHTINQPQPSYGPESFTVGGRYFTLCNTVRQTWTDVAQNIFCDFVRTLPGGGMLCP
jgi:hypothetical protein